MLDQENQPKLILTQVVSITPVEILSAGILAWKKVATELQYSSNDYDYANSICFTLFSNNKHIVGSVTVRFGNTWEFQKHLKSSTDKQLEL